MHVLLRPVVSGGPSAPVGRPRTQGYTLVPGQFPGSPPSFSSARPVTPGTPPSPLKRVGPPAGITAHFLVLCQGSSLGWAPVSCLWGLILRSVSPGPVVTRASAGACARSGGYGESTLTADRPSLIQRERDTDVSAKHRCAASHTRPTGARTHHLGMHGTWNPTLAHRTHSPRMLTPHPGARPPSGPRRWR